MSARYEQLVARRGQLKAHSAVQRAHLARTTGEIEAQLSGIDQRISSVRKIVRNPVLIAGGVALVTLLGPRRILGWVTRGAVFWSTAKSVMGLVR